MEVFFSVNNQLKCASSHRLTFGQLSGGSPVFYVDLFLGCIIPIMHCCIYIAWSHSILCSQETRWKVCSRLCLHRWRSGHRRHPGKHKLRETNTHMLRRLTANKSSQIQNLIHTVPKSEAKVSVHKCGVIVVYFAHDDCSFKMTSGSYDWLPQIMEWWYV